MRSDDFRRIALGMTGAVEGSHMDHPDFRANGRIFATLHGDGTFGMIKLTPEQQRVAIREHPEVFSPESGAWGRQGCTRVRLDAADSETVGDAMTLAWQNSAGSNAARKNAPGKNARKRNAGQKNAGKGNGRKKNTPR
jgi:hypothetical protein